MNLRRKTCLWFVLAGAAAAISACTGIDDPGQSRLRLSDDFGRAVREDITAQIADPDPAWKNTPPPLSSGDRSALAQTKYKTNTVKEPKASSTSTVETSGSGGGGSGGTP